VLRAVKPQSRDNTPKTPSKTAKKKPSTPGIATPTLEPAAPPPKPTPPQQKKQLPTPGKAQPQNPPAFKLKFDNTPPASATGTAPATPPPTVKKTAALEPLMAFGGTPTPKAPAISFADMVTGKVDATDDGNAMSEIDALLKRRDAKYAWGDDASPSVAGSPGTPKK
ncbi:hypothetical protein HK101_005969, partial [Irineochytrium annulatum]